MNVVTLSEYDARMVEINGLRQQARTLTDKADALELKALQRAGVKSDNCYASGRLKYTADGVEGIFDTPREAVVAAEQASKARQSMISPQGIQFPMGHR